MINTVIIQDLDRLKSIVESDIYIGKNVLVTGGAGFIGSWLCDALTGFGANVVCIDDLSTGRIQNINHLIGNQLFTFVKSHVCTFNAEGKFDIIFNMAGHASPDEYQLRPIETLKTSALGSFGMAELARKNDATLLFASTSEVYGDAEVVPTPESYWGKVNPIGIRSCYDEGKRFAEALLVAYNNQHGLDVRLPRIFNTYGPRLREDGLYGRALSRFIFQALTGDPITVYGNGMQTRSFCYVTDTVACLLLLAVCKKAKGEVVNVGNTDEITILELAKKIKEVTQCNSAIKFCPLPKDDPKRRCPDIKKLEKLLQFKPTVKFEEGLKRTITWFQQT